MRRIAALIAAGLLVGAPAWAQAGPEFCTDLKRVIGEIPGEFASLKGGKLPLPANDPERDQRFFGTLKISGSSGCTIQVMAASAAPGFNPTNYYCQWSGLPDGKTGVTALYDAARACIGGDGAEDSGIHVSANSPDYVTAAVVRPGVLIYIATAGPMVMISVSSEANPINMIRPRKGQ